MECEVRSRLARSAAEGQQRGCPFPGCCKPFCAPSSVPLPMLKWEKYTEKLHIPACCRGWGCVLGRWGKILGKLPVYSGATLVSREQNILLKTPFFPHFHLCSNVLGMLTERCVLLPSVLGFSAWERVTKELTPKPRYWNPAFAGCLGIMGHAGRRTWRA